MAGHSDNESGGARENQDLTVLSASDVLRETCNNMLASGDADITLAVAAVYAYSRAFVKGMSYMTMPGCSVADCTLCLLYCDNERVMAKRYVKLFLADIEFLCQEQEDSDDPYHREEARKVQQWIDACRNVTLPARYLKLVSPQEFIG